MQNMNTYINSSENLAQNGSQSYMKTQNFSVKLQFLSQINPINLKNDTCAQVLGRTDILVMRRISFNGKILI